MTILPNRAVRIWLWSIVALIVAIVIVGGATRLTDSGLSITEWKPVTGAIPPLSEQAWMVEFDKYRQIPQYQLINKGMSLEDFKFIYFWEWGHRFLARAIGIVFFIPFVFFWWRNKLDKSMHTPLALLFVLGGLQGFIGWWMVSSGLSVLTSVAPYRLATHLCLAFIIFCVLIQQLTRIHKARHSIVLHTADNVRLYTKILFGVCFVQIFWGAIVAGLDAGLTYTTWPLMDGRLIPTAENLFIQSPAWRNLFENPLTAQFIHRGLAYTLWLLAAGYCVVSWQAPTIIRNGALVIFASVTLQALLGILTLIYQVPLDLALTHQAGALVVIGLITRQLVLVQRPVEGSQKA